MSDKLRVLIVEDVPSHAELMECELRDAGMTFFAERVETKEAYIAALSTFSPDVILSDYSLPAFDGISALKLRLERAPDTPFIFVSGALGEELAIDLLKQGATDYVLKSRLSRLPVAVNRALREVHERKERKHAEEALQRSEAYLAEGQRLSHTGSWAFDVASDKYVYVSEECLRIYEWDAHEGLPNREVISRLIHPEDRDRVSFAHVLREKVDTTDEYKIVLPSGTVKYVQTIKHPVLNSAGDVVRIVGTTMDITDRKRAEEEIWERERELREIVNFMPQMVAVIGPDGRVSYANQVMLQYFGVTLEECRAGDFTARSAHPDEVERFGNERRKALARGLPFESEERLRGKDGKYRWFLVRHNPLTDAQGRVLRWYASLIDIEDRKRGEERLRDENVILREEIDKASMFEEIVGASPALKAVLARVTKVAPTDSSVFITGETGTGKELIARAIHKRSKRSSRPFVSVSCAAIPETLIASELFGHEKGAFTGAHQRRLGRFELAEGGTIFLDEIGELPTETQITLLHVLQEHEFERVGGNQAIRANVRVIAATNRDLKAAIEAGTFRRDLFYRLNVFPIKMPPLRERKEDIPMLVEYFIDRYASKAGKKIRSTDKKTLDLFQSYPWPGNIRELQNVIQRSIILCETENFSVDESWLVRESPEAQPASQPLSDKLVTHEKEMIEAALTESRGRVSGATGAAAKLGIPASTLESKIRSLKINKHRFKPA